MQEVAEGHIYLSSAISNNNEVRVDRSTVNLAPSEKSFAVSLVDSFLFITFENGNTVVVDKSVESDLTQLQIRSEKAESAHWVVLSYFRDQQKQQAYTFILNSEGKIMQLDSKYHNLELSNYAFNRDGKSFYLYDRVVSFKSLDDLTPRLETPSNIIDKNFSMKTSIDVTKSLTEAGIAIPEYKETNPRAVGADGEVHTEKKTAWYENYMEQLRGVDVIHDVDQNLKRRIYEALVDPESGNAVLVSKPGAGKTTLANLIAWEIINRKAPSYFDTFEVLYFDASVISAGSKYRGDFEERVQELKEISQKRNVLWVIDNFTSLKGEGSHSNSNKDILDMIAPELSKGRIRLLAMADVDLYDQTITNEQIRSKVTKINVEQKWGEKHLIKILQNYAQQKYDHKLNPQHVKMILELSEKGEAAGQEPARSLRLVRKVLNGKLLISKGESFKVNKKTIQEGAIELYGFDPAEYKVDAAQAKLTKLAEALRANIVGQEMMVGATLKAAQLVYTNTHDDSKARMGLFFTGPRGLGKTEVPKVYAQAMDKPFFRISMGEYSTPEPGTLEKLKHTIYRQLQKNPHTVLFFDELDKSPMFIQDGLLELFDSKTFNVREKLDAAGRLHKIVRVDISQADVFFAGNSAVNYVYSLSYVPQQEATNRIGFHADHKLPAGQVRVEMNPHLNLDKSVLESHILHEGRVSPYLLSRMVEIVPAFPPSPQTFYEILNLHIDRAIQSLEEKLKIKIDYAPTDKEFLTERLVDMYWDVNRDNRVDGIINDWVREPIARAVHQVPASSIKGLNIYVTGANHPSQVVTLPKEVQVERSYQCKRMFF